MSDSTAVSKRPKGRSPAYPAVSLEKAVQRVRQLYKTERQYPIHVHALPEIWGYTALNGPASLNLSALSKFGLVEVEGARDDRTARVTDLAVQILEHPSTDARDEAIREAAMLPPIHQEMWEEYGPRLPSDANLMWRLTRIRGFTETGAKEFIREWRETMQFAQLDELTPVGSAEPEQEPDAETDVDIEDSDATGIETSKSFGEMTSAELQAQPGYAQKMARGRELVEQMFARPPQFDGPAVQSYPIPIALSGRPPVQVTGAFPLSEVEWTQFMAVLSAMKPVLVGEIPPTQPAEAQQLSE
ncbi:hypothetical protein [Microbacterium sp. NPDC079995]|uniref:hypothetical protein n=1 Tax=unclassified Microbacterium TaxID=2609290 RepID=UPI00344C20C6